KEQEEIVGKEDPLSDGRCLCGLCVLETVTNVSDAVRHAPRRRKLLLFIGSRLIVQAGPRAPSADIGCSGRLADARRRLTDSLALSNLTVHSIDPGGLVNLGPQARAGAGGGKPGQDGPVLRRQALRVETTEQLEEYGSLRVLPELTGGRTVLNTNAPESAVPEIFRESDAYYVLGFEPDPSTRAGTAPRSIEVKVSRRDVTVHAQRRHVAERAEDRPASDASGSPGAVSLTGALSGLLPNAGRPLVLAAAAFAGDDPAKAIASISVDVGAFVPAAGGTVALDLALAAVDPGGTPVASARQTSTVVLPRSAAGRAPEAIVQTQLEVPPGEHEIRVAVSDPATGAIGSVFSPLSVPRFGSAALSMSDVVLSAEPATGVSSAVPGGQASATTRRTFNGEDRVRARLAVYQGTDRTAPILPVSIRARVLDLDGAAVRDHTLRLAETQFTNRRAACQIALDVERLPPGEYLLRLDAGAGEEAASRAVRFAVR
ncbi:MAG TPA: hypothetical protein VD833_10575, partial [Vicinamibacterales bacterium]|nr:hypothetical protein [Vicinamibacterales bacterium]